MDPKEALVVVCTHPQEGAAELARTLVSERLAACVQVGPVVSSTYRWEGEIEVAEEVRLEMKTSRARMEALQARVVELHPYDVPEVLVLGVEGGLAGYLEWVGESVGE